MRRHLLRLVTVTAVALGVWLALRGVSASALLRAVASTNVWFVLSWSLPLLALGSLLRAGRYRALLPGEPGFFQIWSTVVTSGAANNVLPLRAGELVRTRETMALGLPLSRVAFAQVAEKVVEAVTLVAWTAPVLASYLGRSRVGIGLACAVAASAAGVTWVVRRGRRELLRSFLAASAWSFVADAVEIAVIAACLRGVGLPSGLSPSVTIFAAVNLAIAVPSTPGNVGAFEAGAALPLIAMGSPRDAAVAFALVYRAVQWLPVTVVGGIVWARRLRLEPSSAAS